jgi:hypothetical protein
MSALIDDVSRIIASPISRRKAFRLVGGAVGGAVLASLGLGTASRGLGAPGWAQQGQDQGGGDRHRCRDDQVACGRFQCCDKDDQCCNGDHCCPKTGVCCAGKRCCRAGESCCGRRACCRADRVCCNDRCVRRTASGGSPCADA